MYKIRQIVTYHRGKMLKDKNIKQISNLDYFENHKMDMTPNQLGLVGTTLEQLWILLDFHI